MSLYQPLIFRGAADTYLEYRQQYVNRLPDSAQLLAATDRPYGALVYLRQPPRLSV
jgi:hypothetical protein